MPNYWNFLMGYRERKLIANYYWNTNVVLYVILNVVAYQIVQFTFLELYS